MQTGRNPFAERKRIFALFRLCELRQLTQIVFGIREDEMLRWIYLSVYILLWSGSLHQILYTIGSRSPHTKRIGRNWTAPLSSLISFIPPSRGQKLNAMTEDRKDKCEKCGWSFNENPQKCPNCNAPTVTIQGTCVHCGRIGIIQYHPVEHPVPHGGSMLRCKSCSSMEFKNITIIVERK